MALVFKAPEQFSASKLKEKLIVTSHGDIVATKEITCFSFNVCCGLNFVIMEQSARRTTPTYQ